MVFALTPNFKVDIVSAKLYILGEQVTIKVVLELPPKVSYKILVNLEFL